jgi:hypothetical protein
VITEGDEGGTMPTGIMVYWRFKKNGREWRFGYVTHVSGYLYRMGLWNGNDSSGPIVDVSEIEWRARN